MNLTKSILITVILITFSSLTLAEHFDAGKKVLVWNVSVKEGFYKDGSYGQFTGESRIVTYGIGVHESQLDSTIKRVGFSGLKNGKSFSVEKSRDQGKRLIWSFDFKTYNQIMGESWNRYEGAFFVETIKGNYYWLKMPNGSDFEIDLSTSVNLSSYQKN